MTYNKVAANLRLDEAVQNMKAVADSAYFGQYETLPLGTAIRSDLIQIEHLGGHKVHSTQRFLVSDIASIVGAVLDTIRIGGVLGYANINMTPTQQMIRKMGFEERFIEEELELELSVTINKSPKSGVYTFQVTNWGFKASYFEEYKLDLADANRRLSAWYREVTKHMNAELPHRIQNFSL